MKREWRENLKVFEEDRERNGLFKRFEKIDLCNFELLEIMRNICKYLNNLKK